MNRRLRGLIFTIPGVAIGFVGAASCDKLPPSDPPGSFPPFTCGPCGTVAKGDFNPSGDARLDGFLQAVQSLKNATASTQSDFEANMVALANVYGVNASAGYDASLVDEVIAAIEADTDQTLDGGLHVTYRSPSCEADVSVSVQAQARCEASAGCDVSANPGQASVKCSGICNGSCSGKCSGDLSCTVTTPTVDCEGTCDGTCELSAGASCDGNCHGKCSAGCSATDANGDCQGTCSGTCTGSCELESPGKCTGTCHGSCHVNQDSKQCTGDVKCSGQCDADCTGGCQGDFEPPNASAMCDAAVDCEAQAKAQGKAALVCQPPRLDIAYGFKAGVKAADRADVVAHLGELKLRAPAIVAGAARLSALVTGKVDGQVVFKPSPLDELVSDLQALASADVVAKVDIPVGRLPCVIPAFVNAGRDLTDVGSMTLDTIKAQAKFVGFIAAGS